MRREVARFTLPGPVVLGTAVRHDPDRTVYVFEMEARAAGNATVETYVLVNHGEGTADFCVRGRVDVAAVRAIVLAHDAGLEAGLRLGRRQVAGHVSHVIDSLRACADTGAPEGVFAVFGR